MDHLDRSVFPEIQRAGSYLLLHPHRSIRATDQASRDTSAVLGALAVRDDDVLINLSLTELPLSLTPGRRRLSTSDTLEPCRSRLYCSTWVECF